MKRYVHLKEAEMRSLLHRIVESAEEKRQRGGRKSSFLICSQDYEDFDEIISIIEELGAECEKQSEGVYLVKCKRGETSDIRQVVKSLSDKHKLDHEDTFWGRRTCCPSNFPDEWSDNDEWQYKIKFDTILDKRQGKKDRKKDTETEEKRRKRQRHVDKKRKRKEMRGTWGR